MKAFLIDPYSETVTEVQTSGGLGDSTSILPGVYAVLSGPSKRVDCVDIVALNDIGDVIYVDDEGLLFPGVPCFHIFGGQTLAGRGLVLGTDDEGDSCAPKGFTRLDVEAMVTWPGKETTGEVGMGRAMTDAEREATTLAATGTVPDFGYVGGSGILAKRGTHKPD